MKNAVITISRQYGSGGHEIGKKLAEALGIPCYDNELISLAASDSGIKADLFQSAEIIPANNFLYSLSMLGPSTEIYGIPLNEKIFNVQSNVIRRLASSGPCVLIGRCADYVLKDFDNCIHIFISASLSTRVRRAVSQYHIPEEGAERKVIKTDKSRETYYNYHTGLKWGHPSNYDMILNIDHTGIDDAVEILKSYVTIRQKKEMFDKPVH